MFILVFVNQEMIQISFKLNFRPSDFDAADIKYFTVQWTCVRKLPLRLTLVVDVERWLSYKGTYVILLAKLHDMYPYKTDTFFSHQPLFKVSLKDGSLTQVSLYAKTLNKASEHFQISQYSSYLGFFGSKEKLYWHAC